MSPRDQRGGAGTPQAENFSWSLPYTLLSYRRSLTAKKHLSEAEIDTEGSVRNFRLGSFCRERAYFLASVSRSTA